MDSHGAAVSVKQARTIDRLVTEFARRYDQVFNETDFLLVYRHRGTFEALPISFTGQALAHLMGLTIQHSAWGPKVMSAQRLFEIARYGQGVSRYLELPLKSAAKSKMSVLPSIFNFERNVAYIGEFKHGSVGKTECDALVGLSGDCALGIRFTQDAGPVPVSCLKLNENRLREAVIGGELDRVVGVLSKSRREPYFGVVERFDEVLRDEEKIELRRALDGYVDERTLCAKDDSWLENMGYAAVAGRMNMVQAWDDFVSQAPCLNQRDDDDISEP